MNGALLRFSVPEQSLGRALGRNAIVIAVTTAIGPTLAGTLLSVAGWQWLFAINIPLGIAAILLGWHVLPDNVGSGRHLDWVSAILNAVTFGAPILGAESISRHGLYVGLATLGVGVVTGVALVMRERVLELFVGKARSGAAGGVLAMARLLGQTVGTVIIAIVFHVAGLGASSAALAGAAAWP